MGMSEFYGPANEEESIATIHLALDLGVTHFDTADVYGPHTNEILVGRALAGHRHRATNPITIATKFGNVRDASGAWKGVSGKPEYVRQSCEASLRRLNVETIDLYYQHRVDADTPIEETVGAMAQLVKEGKVRYLGLSEAGATTMRRACAVHPITALQTEYSLWTRDPEDGILAACRELGVGFVAYSPLGRGFLSGRIKSRDDLDPTDYRRMAPRLQGENKRGKVSAWTGRFVLLRFVLSGMVCGNQISRMHFMTEMACRDYGRPQAAIGRRANCRLGRNLTALAATARLDLQQVELS